MIAGFAQVDMSFRPFDFGGKRSQLPLGSHLSIEFFTSSVNFRATDEALFIRNLLPLRSSFLQGRVSCDFPI